MGDGPGNTNNGYGGHLHNFSCGSIDGYCIKSNGHRSNDRINGGHHVVGSRAVD